MHRGCFVWTPTAPLSGRRTPRPGPACVRVPALLGRVVRARLPGAFWCASHFPLAVLSFFFARPHSGLRFVLVVFFFALLFFFPFLAPPLSPAFCGFCPWVPLALALCVLFCPPPLPCNLPSSPMPPPFFLVLVSLLCVAPPFPPLPPCASPLAPSLLFFFLGGLPCFLPPPPLCVLLCCCCAVRVLLLVRWDGLPVSCCAPWWRALPWRGAPCGLPTPLHGCCSWCVVVWCAVLCCGLPFVLVCVLLCCVVPACVPFGVLRRALSCRAVCFSSCCWVVARCVVLPPVVLCRGTFLCAVWCFCRVVVLRPLWLFVLCGVLCLLAWCCGLVWGVLCGSRCCSVPCFAELVLWCLAVWCVAVLCCRLLLGFCGYCVVCCLVRCCFVCSGVACCCVFSWCSL